MRARIELMRQVCAAVQYAHQNLVVHRDLKPSNILVTADGVPKLLDFGIAKLLHSSQDRAGLTATGVAPWTPDYASPEQVRAQAVTTRSDVYSLGLVLFELLTGERAQKADTSSPLALDRSICETETPHASTRAPGSLVRQVAGDLDAIAQATHKDPDRRYASMEEFSEGLGRYLDHQPLRARRGESAYPARKFLRRHWLPVSAAGFAALALIVGAAGFAWQARVADRNRAAVEQERDRATQEHGIAEQQRDAALREQRRAGDMAQEAGTQRKRADRRTSEMSGLAQHAVFDLYSAVERVSGSLEARHKMLLVTVDYLEKLRPDVGGDPEFLRALGDAYQALGDVLGQPGAASMGDLAGAAANYRKALAVLEPLAAQHPQDVRFQTSLLGPLDRLGDLLRTSATPDESRQYLERALAAARRAAALAPDQPQVLEQVGIVTRDLSLLLLPDDIPRGEPYLRESLEIYTRLLAKDPDNDGFLDNIAGAYNRLSTLEGRNHDLKGGLDHARRGAEIREKVLQHAPEDVVAQRNLMISYGRVGDVLGGTSIADNLGDTQGAIEYYRICIAIAQRMLTKDPKSQTARFDLPMSQFRAGSTMASPEQGDESLDLIERAGRGFEALWAAAPSNLNARLYAGAVLTFMTIRLLAAGDVEGALDRATRAVEHMEAASVQGATCALQLALTRQLRAVVLARSGDRSRALDHTGKAAELFRKFDETASLMHAPLYWSRVGDMYEALTFGVRSNADRRQADWTAAKDAYRRSAAAERKGSTPGSDAETARLESKIAEGDAKMAAPSAVP